MTTAKEMKAYLLGELKTERSKMLQGLPNDYSYIFMLCNDMGLTEEEAEQPKRYVFTEKGAASWGRGVQAGDIYDRPVRKSVLKQYIRAGFIAEAV